MSRPTAADQLDQLAEEAVRQEVLPLLGAAEAVAVGRLLALVRRLRKEVAPLPSIPLQKLSDCGLNPFAAKLLTESWRRHPEPVPVSFVLDGVLVTLQPATADRAQRALGDRRQDGV